MNSHDAPGAAGASSLAGRALIAVVLMIGFYVLALAIAASLLLVVYAEATRAQHLHIKLLLLCVVGAGAIVWSVLPRFDRFEPPGPVLERQRHPRLFAEIDGIARAVGQESPAEVFLVSDINAWVAQRGGVMGFGSRRVMGLGLPLLRVLGVTEFRAVLAHEFGHYDGGDTRLGPWIYKTRGAIGRTVHNLGQTGSLLQLPFLWYGKMFLRVTHAVSRRQEFVADALAARTIGARPLSDGLRKVEGAAPAFQAYWQSECLPVLGAGYRPPIAEGFADFVQSRQVAIAMDAQVAQSLAAGATDPYDTHPPLRERIAAVASLPAGEVPDSDPPASSLLEEVPALERALLVAMAGAEQVDPLKPIPWSEVGSAVYQPRWRELQREHAAALEGLTAEALPDLVADPGAFARRFLKSGTPPPAEAEAQAYAQAVVGAALALAALAQGAELGAGLGEAVSVRQGGVRMEPFSALAQLAHRQMSAADWNRIVDALGLRGVDLSAGLAKPA